MDGQRINVHPLVNTMTSGLSREGFLKFLSITGHKPVMLAKQDHSAESQVQGPK
jgi:Ala-tRNA(Pro) deacylase